MALAMESSDWQGQISRERRPGEAPWLPMASLVADYKRAFVNVAMFMLIWGATYFGTSHLNANISNEMSHFTEAKSWEEEQSQQSFTQPWRKHDSIKGIRIA